MKRRVLAAMSLVLAACSGASPSDGGVDAGADAGPVCTGVPARLTQYTCVEATLSYPSTCQASFEATLAQQTADCDAGPGIVGYVAEGDCADLRSVSWVYGFPGDTYECFYARDGGAWTGSINYSDRGVFLGGHVGDCTPRPPPTCRDGG
jgi:hypothetical protein